MRDLIFEIGAEDIPPRYAYSALEQLKEKGEELLKKNRLKYKSVQVMGTQRRLVFKVIGLEELQEDEVREVRGPAVKVAFTSSGEPTAALKGFLRAYGGDLSQIEIRETNKGNYVYLKVFTSGDKTENILTTLLPELIRSLKFEEGMRWIPNSSFKFIRPIRWLLALYGSDVIAFNFENLRSDRYTFGHRILSPGKLEIPKVNDYEKVLSENGVIVSIRKREEEIRSQLKKLLEDKGLTYKDEDLIKEWVFLAEKPVLFLTSFSETYLSLPPELVVSVVKGQQKFLPLYKEDGSLSCSFIALKDGSEEHVDIAKFGARKVVMARLFDANYFLEEDKKKPLDDYLEGLKGIIFHRELGTIYDKVFRLQDIVKYILEMMGVTDEKTISNAIRAAYLCKADLVTHTVSEFPELQGIIGKYLALYYNEPLLTAEAIAEHYQPRTSDDKLPSTLIGTALALADRFDTLVGFAAINILPKGTKDMYGLKRAMNQIIQIVVDKELRLNIGKIIDFTYKLFEGTFKLKLSLENLRNALYKSFSLRFEEHLKRKYPLDIIRSVSHVFWRDTWLALRLLNFLTEKRGSEEFVNIAKLGVRLKNILKGVSKAELKEISLDESLLEASEEWELYKWLRENREAFRKALSNGNLERAYELLRELAGVVERFFQNVFVMVDDERLRLNRLKLLKELDDLITEMTDFSKIVV